MGDVLLRRYRIFAAMAFYAVWAAGVVFRAVSDRVGDLLCALAGASAAAMWCVVDSLVRGRYWPWSLHWITFWVWPLGVPGYLIWSRGRRGVALSLLAALGIVAAVLVGELAAWILAKI